MPKNVIINDKINLNQDLDLEKIVTDQEVVNKLRVKSIKNSANSPTKNKNLTINSIVRKAFNNY